MKKLKLIVCNYNVVYITFKFNFHPSTSITLDLGSVIFTNLDKNCMEILHIAYPNKTKSHCHKPYKLEELHHSHPVLYVLHKNNQ